MKSSLLERRSIWGGVNSVLSISDDDDEDIQSSSIPKSSKNVSNRNTPSSNSERSSSPRRNESRTQRNEYITSPSNSDMARSSPLRNYTTSIRPWSAITGSRNRSVSNQIYMKEKYTQNEKKSTENSSQRKSSLQYEDYEIQNSSYMRHHIQLNSDIQMPLHVIARRKIILGPIFARITDSLIVYIMTFLSLNDLLSISLACRKLFDLSSNDDIWKRLFVIKFFTSRVPIYNVKTAFLVRLEYAETENNTFSYRSLDPISIFSDDSHVLLVLKYELKLDENEWNIFQKEQINGQDFLQLTSKELQEEFGLKYSTRKRILDYIDTVKMLPELRDISILEELNLEERLNSKKILSYNEKNHDLLDRVDQVLNDISTLLDTKGLLFLMPYSLKVTRQDMLRCESMYRKKEIGDERRVVLSTELPINHFSDLYVKTKSSSKFHKKELGKLNYLNHDSTPHETIISTSAPVHRFQIHDTDAFLSLPISSKKDDSFKSFDKNNNTPPNHVEIEKKPYQIVNASPINSLQEAKKIYSSPLKIKDRAFHNSQQTESALTPRLMKNHASVFSNHRSNVLSEYDSNKYQINEISNGIDIHIGSEFQVYSPSSKFEEDRFVKQIVTPKRRYSESINNSIESKFTPRKPETPRSKDSFKRLMNLQMELTLATPRNQTKNTFNEQTIPFGEESEYINRNENRFILNTKSLKAKLKEPSKQLFPPIKPQIVSKENLNENLIIIEDLMKQVI